MKTLNTEQQQLAAENIRLAYWCAHREKQQRRSHGMPFDVDELQGEALAALCKAAAYFDPSKGYRFASYAVHVIKRRFERLRLGNACRKRQPIRSTTKTQCEVPRTFYSEVERAIDHRNAAIGTSMEAAELVAYLRTVLAPSGFALLWSVFADSRQQTDLARELGVTRSRVGQRVQEAVIRARSKCPEQ